MTYIIDFIMSKIISPFISKVSNTFFDEKRKDKEYLKQVIREAVVEARKELTKLRTYEFKIMHMHGNRWRARMDELAEKLSSADPELGDAFFDLVNAPFRLNAIPDNLKDNAYKTERKNFYFRELKEALLRCSELEKNPLKKIK